MDKNKEVLKSKEVQKVLKIRACDLMHFREAGKIRFEKKGNAFLYNKEDIDKLLNQDKI